MALSIARSGASLRRAALRVPSLSLLSQQRLCTHLPRFKPSMPLTERRCKSTKAVSPEDMMSQWEKYLFDESSILEAGNSRVGFLSKRRNVSNKLSFADLTMPSGEIIQLCSTSNPDDHGSQDLHKKFKAIAAHTPVIVNVEPETSGEERTDDMKPSFNLKSIRTLNAENHNLIVTSDVQFPPEKRNLQIRFHPELQARLQFRSWLKNNMSQSLNEMGFADIETPTLFKSTPEGAREFLVPTRQRSGAKAYALSQSPQQYKQALMASGVTRYMQWARCYRDEDARTDRQPEFTQLDMEWAFAGSKTVQRDVNKVVLQALEALRPAETYDEVRGEKVPLVSRLTKEQAGEQAEAHVFTHMTYNDAIELYGSDKPDLRIPGRIHAINDLEPFQHFVSMITKLEDPLVEVSAFSLDDVSPSQAKKLLVEFMDNMPKKFKDNTDGLPQVLVYDSRQPLNGLSSLGADFDAIDKLVEQISPEQPLQDGDLIIFQARQRPKTQFSAGSTHLGDFRRLLWKHLVDEGLMPAPPPLGVPGSLQFLWVTEFPMFKMVEEGEPGQGGEAGIAAAHHPFTAPLSRADYELLLTDPMRAKSAAYDLVLNGVEIGGGSVRNHIASFQRFIMSDVLKMSKAGMAQFNHLFEVLESACPPHAGFALGFDRLCALMSGTSTVRDVIAFPKTMKGEDLFVKSPSKISNEQWAPYNLRIGNAQKAEAAVAAKDASA